MPRVVKISFEKSPSCSGLIVYWSSNILYKVYMLFLEYINKIMANCKIEENL